MMSISTALSISTSDWPRPTLSTITTLYPANRIESDRERNEERERERKREKDRECERERLRDREQ